MARQLVLPEGVREAHALAIRDGKVLASVQGGDRLWTAYDTSVPVPDSMTAVSLTRSGLVTGCLRTPDFSTVPAVWSPGGAVETLPAPSPGCGALVGENGDVMGSVRDDSRPNHKPVVWRRG